MAQVTQYVSSGTFEESYTISATDRRRIALEEVNQNSNKDGFGNP